MTPDADLRADLDALIWTPSDLAWIAGVNDRQARRWYSGADPVPERIARWVRLLADFHRKNPPPARPDAPRKD